jgi:tRNA dimethylallyltransferase
MNTPARLVVVLGPTASGKSVLGIRLAQELGGEIVVCDSTQVYRRFDIGTAKVPAAERHAIPHHLVDLIEPDEVFTAGDYRRRALIVLEEICRRGKTPILTAGTGLYLRALLEGLADAPTRSEDLRERLRQIVTARGPAHLHQVLARLDRATAKRIAPGDTQKVIRALEMRLLTGRAVGEIHASGRSGLEGFEVRKIGLLPPRRALYDRTDRRVTAMLASGWIEEVRELVQQVPADVKPFDFIGYTQLRAHLQGRLRIEDATRQIQQATRRFAKRQITWFRRESNVQWLAGFGDDPEISAATLECLHRNPA